MHGLCAGYELPCLIPVVGLTCSPEVLSVA